MANPGDVTGLAFRLRASQIAGVADGGTVTTVTSEVGAVTLVGTSLSGGTTKPTLHVNQVGGKPGILLSDYCSLIANDATKLQATFAGDGFTYVFVAKILGGDIGTIASKNSPNNYATFLISGNTDVADGRIRLYNGTNSVQSNNSLNDGSYHFVAVAANNLTQTGQIYVDGAAAGTGQIAPSRAEAGQPFALGSTGDGAFAANISLAEMLVYSRVLTADDVTILAQYVHSEYGLGTSAFAGGSLTISRKTSTTANLIGTASTGGTGAVTYAWYRDVVENFTPAVGNRVGTGLSYSDSGLTAGSTYYYKRVATDSTAATAISAITVTMLRTNEVVIIDAGDSITEQNEVLPLQKKLLSCYTRQAGDITIINKGAGGRHSGSWVSEANGGEAGLLSGLIAAVNSGGSGMINWALGTNDARLDVNHSKATFKANTISSIDSIIAGCTMTPIINLQKAPSPVAGFNNLALSWDASSYLLIEQYHAAIDEIAAMPAYAGIVIAGSPAGYHDHTLHPDLWLDQIHPQDATAALPVAQAWAQGNAVGLGLSPAVGASASGATIEEIVATLQPQLDKIDAMDARLPDDPAAITDVQGATIYQVLNVSQGRRIASSIPVFLKAGNTGLAVSLDLIDGDDRPLLFTGSEDVTFTLRKLGAMSPVLDGVAASFTATDREGVRSALFLFTTGAPVPSSGEYEATFNIGTVTYPMNGTIRVIIQEQL